MHGGMVTRALMPERHGSSSWSHLLVRVACNPVRMLFFTVRQTCLALDLDRDFIVQGTNDRELRFHSAKNLRVHSSKWTFCVSFSLRASTKQRWP